MSFNPAIAKAVEQLDYRVTVGDVAAQAGLEVNFAQQGLLALASDAGGQLQVSESGEIAYLFPQNFRAIARNKYWKLRWQEGWEKVAGILFYLLRISFGIVLILSILLMVAAIAVLFVYINSNKDDNNESRGGGGGVVFFPRIWGPDLFWWIDPGSWRSRRSRARSHPAQPSEMSFLEAVFSFLFGDGDPNADLEERRWQTIGAVIRNAQGAVVAEQISPYLDSIETRHWEDENYMIPVLARFNGYPQVSKAGAIVYAFPELQVTAGNSERQAIPDFLEEQRWRFSAASSGQIFLAAGLGSLNLILAFVLYSLLQDPSAAGIGGYVGFVASIYWFLLGYGVAFLGLPLIRHFWNQWRNPKIEARNQERRDRAQHLNSASATLQRKLADAQQFASREVVREGDLAYTTETDLLAQNLDNADKIDAAWEKRLESED